jgi:adenosylcobinamide amidohydrolase
VPASSSHPASTTPDAEVLEVGAARALVVRLGGLHEVVSWALVNGGRCRTDAVVWREVRRGELGPDSDARSLMRETLVRVGRPEAVGLLTARDVRRFEEERLERGGVRARCVATVGLGNALAAGDPTTTTAVPARETAGTINVLCAVSVALSEEGLLEALALAAEARTAALLGAGVPSVVSGRPASGTGTDCIVLAARVGSAPGAGPLHAFAGKHTTCGSAIGAAVHAAVERGVQRWLEENACTPR